MALRRSRPALLCAALRLWREAHAALDHALTESVAERLRGDLGQLVIRADPDWLRERRDAGCWQADF